MTLWQILLWLVSLPVLAGVAWLLLLTLAAFAFRRRGGQPAEPPPHLLFVVPAHNEEGGIANTVDSILKHVRYPAGRLSVLVLADNCTDGTAAAAAAAGATVYERTDTLHRGKGQALNWLFTSHAEILDQVDGVAIIDADSLVDPGFAAAIAASFADPAVEVVQAFGGVANPQAGWRPSLLEAALAVFHHLRPAGSNALGGSAALKGNGVVLRAGLLKRTGWPSFSIVEDIEFGILLATEGVAVYYNPDAVVLSEMASRGGQAAPQRDRWEGGRLGLLRRYGPALARRLARRPSRLVLDALIDLMLPPLSMLVLALVLLALPAWFLAPPLFWTLLGSLPLLAAYVVAGMALRGVSRHAWLALLAAPFYLLWKVPLYFRMLLGRRGKLWNRTVRQHELAGNLPAWPAAVLLGVPIHPLTLEATVDFIFARLAEPGAAARPGLVTTINVDFLVNALSWFDPAPRHPELTAVLRRPLLSTADGMPLVWAGRLLGAALPERVSGADLVPALAARAAKEGRSLYLLGGRREVAEEAAAILVERYPGLRIAGIDSPFVHTEGTALATAVAEDAAVCDRINQAAPDILLIGFGNPKQELWFERNRHRLRVPVSLGVGGTVNFITGRVKRAPVWMQKAGMEWLFRLWQEPRRLWKRYGIGLAKLSLLLLPAVAVYRLLRLRMLFTGGNAAADAGGVTLFIGGSATLEVVRLPRRLEAANAGAFFQIATTTVADGPVVVDGRELACIDAAGLGTLLEFWERAEVAGRMILMFGLRPGIRWSLKASRIHDHFAAGLCGSARELVARLRGALPGCRGLAAVDAAGGVRVLRFLGEVGAADLADLGSAGLASLLAGAPCVVDLGLCTQLDTAGIGLLETIRRECSRQQVPCVFCNLSGTARQAVRAARLEAEFRIVDSLNQAVFQAKLGGGTNPCE
jgi:exopolysaccharide biosynthesis WecB/TagA/CpsF family protein